MKPKTIKPQQVPVTVKCSESECFSAEIQQLTMLIYKLKVEICASSESLSLSETKSFDEILTLFKKVCYFTNACFIETLYENRYEPNKLPCLIERKRQQIKKMKVNIGNALDTIKPLPSFEVSREWEGVKDEGDFVSFAVNKKTMELIGHELVDTEDTATITINRNEYEAARKNPTQFKSLIKSKLQKI